MHYLHPVYLLTHVFPLLVLGALILRAFGVKALGIIFAPFRLLRFLLVIALIGLMGCASREKLAVAQGPLFALNPDHWQATPQDLEAPPSIGKK